MAKKPKVPTTKYHIWTDDEGNTHYDPTTPPPPGAWKGMVVPNEGIAHGEASAGYFADQAAKENANRPATNFGSSVADALAHVGGTGGIFKGGGQDPEDPVQTLLNQLMGYMPPAPNHGTYMAPFDQADHSAHASYDAALPVINGVYDKLRGDLGADNQRYLDFANQQSNMSAQRADSASQQLAALTGGLGGQVAALNQGQPTDGLVGALAAQQQGRQADLGLQQQSQQQLLANLQSVAEGSHADRMAGADTARAGQLSTAQNNLASILQQISEGRAGAERQFQSDSQQSAAQKAQLALQAHEQVQSQATERAKAYADALKQSRSTAGAQFQSKINDFVSQNPTIGNALLGVIDEAKSGSTPSALARARAESWLNASAVDDGSTDPSRKGQPKVVGGKPVSNLQDLANHGIDINQLRQALDAFYDPTETNDESVLQRLLGG